MSINLSDIERELSNREHEIIEVLKEVTHKDSDELKQALHRIREAIMHVQKARK